MEHIFFGVQLCIKISIFNEKSDFCYSDHPEITPGLLHRLEIAVLRLLSGRLEAI